MRKPKQPIFVPPQEHEGLIDTSEPVLPSHGPTGPMDAPAKPSEKRRGLSGYAMQKMTVPPVPPEWLCAIGWKVQKLVLEPENMKRFRQEILKWSKESHSLECDLLLLGERPDGLEKRPDSPREMSVVLAAVHDSLCKEFERIAPWTDEDGESSERTKYLGIVFHVPWMIGTQRHKPILESFLDSVTRDLPVKVGQVETEGDGKPPEKAGQGTVGRPRGTKQASRGASKLKAKPARDQVFICYSRKDQKWLEELQTHLKPYGSVTVWSDKQIAPGAEWFAEIKKALACTKVGVLLVTPNFLASDFIHEHELTPLLKEAEKGNVCIIWIPVRACSYKETPLKDDQAAIDPKKPLANMKAERDKAWVQICKEIEKAVGR